MREKISILIITRNRAGDLKELLHSITKQTVKPLEVIVVDNGSADATKKTSQWFTRYLPLIYVYEEKVGIPFARNTSIRKARGTILVFTDDDCVWPAEYLERVEKSFRENKSVNAVIGYTKPLTITSITLVEQFYYERWLRNFVTDFEEVRNVNDGRVFDFKNLSVRCKTLKSMKNLFDENYADCNKEDIEFGVRLKRICKKVLFDPQIILFHKNSNEFMKLFLRNFKYGRSTFELEKRAKIFLKVVNPLTLQITLLNKQLGLLDSFLAKTEFAVLVFLYPFASKLGYLLASFNKRN